MKHLFITIAFISFCIIGNCQTWQHLGPNNADELGITENSKLLSLKTDADTLYAIVSTDYPSFVFKKYDGVKWDTITTYSYSPTTFASMDNHFVPYINDYSNATVKKYVNGTWVQVGGIVMPYNINYSSMSIYFGKADTPYVLYSVAGNMKAAKFDGTQWVNVGSSTQFAIATSRTMAFDTAGIPYVAFSDPGISNRARVMKFDGTTWVSISPLTGLSTLAASSFDIKFDQTTNLLYLKYNDVATGYVVQKYDGTTWSLVGGQSTTIGLADNLYVNASGVPFLSIRNADSLWLMKYDGVNWTKTTTCQKKANVSTLYPITFLSFLHDTIPVLGCQYIPYNYKPMICKYTGSNWEKIGTYGFVEEGVYNNYSGNGAYNTLRLIVTSDNTPYMIFSDQNQQNKLSLMKYSNGNWQYAGTPGLTNTYSTPLQFKKGKNDTLFVLYQGLNTIRLAYFNGNTLVNINSGLPNQGYPTGTAFTLDTAGVPYVTYPDLFNPTTIKKWQNGIWNSVISLPCTTAVQIQINKQNEIYALYDSVATVGNNTFSKLLKYTNNSLVPIVQSPFSGILKIAPNDSLFLLATRAYFYTGTGGGQIPPTYYYYNRTLYRLIQNNWLGAASVYSSPVTTSGPPTVSQKYSNVVFDSSSIPYVVSCDVDFSIVASLPYNPPNMTAPASGWKKFPINSYDIAVGSNNKLITAYSYGTAYALSFQPSPPPPPPVLSSSTQYYCQGDTAAQLSATGQGLRWYGYGLGIFGSSGAPTPSTAAADTFYWWVSQSSGIYESSFVYDTVIVLARPTILPDSANICTGDTLLLNTPTVPGAVYHWTSNIMVNGNMVTTSFDSTSTIPITETGTYFVKVTPNGCTSENTYITAIPTINPTLTISGPSNATIGDLVTVTSNISVGTTNDYVINWYVNGVLQLSTNLIYYYTKGAGNDTIMGVLRPDTPTACHYSDTSASIIISELPNSIATIDGKTGVKAYPNPFTDKLTVTGLEKGTEVLLYSTQGMLLRSWKAEDGNTASFAMEKIPSGTYFLKIIGRNNSITLPLTKM